MDVCMWMHEYEYVCIWIWVWAMYMWICEYEYECSYMNMNMNVAIWIWMCIWMNMNMNMSVCPVYVKLCEYEYEDVNIWIWEYGEMNTYTSRGPPWVQTTPSRGGTAAAPWIAWQKKKERETWSNTIWRHLKNEKNRLACIPDSGPAVVLSAPRSAFLPDFQPAGASRSPFWAQEQTQHNTSTKTPTSIHIYMHFRSGTSIVSGNMNSSTVSSSMNSSSRSIHSISSSLSSTSIISGTSM
jgi:hypothetical protein